MHGSFCERKSCTSVRANSRIKSGWQLLPIKTFSGTFQYACVFNRLRISLSVWILSDCLHGNRRVSINARKTLDVLSGVLRHTLALGLCMSHVLSTGGQGCRNKPRAAPRVAPAKAVGRQPERLHGLFAN